MIIASKRKNQVVNTDAFAAIFVNSGSRIIGEPVNGKSCVIDEYDSREAALKAMEILVCRMRTASDIVYMPTDEEVSTALKGQREHHHSIDGRKTKGYGGS